MVGTASWIFETSPLTPVSNTKSFGEGKGRPLTRSAEFDFGGRTRLSLSCRSNTFQPRLLETQRHRDHRGGRRGNLRALCASVFQIQSPHHLAASLSQGNCKWSGSSRSGQPSRTRAWGDVEPACAAARGTNRQSVIAPVPLGSRHLQRELLRRHDPLLEDDVGIERARTRGHNGIGLSSPVVELESLDLC